MNLSIRFLVLMLILISSPIIHAGPSLGMAQSIVETKTSPGAFPLVNDRIAASLYVDPLDHAGVRRAAADLQLDIERVTKLKPQLHQVPPKETQFAIIIGTTGKSDLIKKLTQSGKLKTDSIDGKWESFLITVVSDPLPGVDRALVIAGSDKRGTIFGIYEISEQIGVSPWHWWADVPLQSHDTLFVKAGEYVQGPPAVKYRGIFINDEEPALGQWSRAKFGGVNSKMYAHMFELILRLRGNYLWPAMWGKAFNENDPLNPQLADEYGIVMGTSHHEPMLRAQSEWTRNKKNYGNSEWNYLTNESGLKQFWTDGVNRNKHYESIYTMGMRGDGDIPMPDAGGLDANLKLLEKIIHDQQDILSKNINADLDSVPQVWTLFTEVQQYYDAGLKLPDNITILFADDNVGNIRRVPSAAERNRKAGSGIYYHMDMHGGPFSYKWLNSNPLPKIWEQMNLAYEYGAREIWIVNIGDLKPLEVPMEFFLRMAWNPRAMTKEKIADYTRNWASREFGPEYADEIADIVSKYAKYNAWRKPEVLRPETYSLINYNEAQLVSQAWSDIATRAIRINDLIPPAQRDAYYQLVLHPTLASANFVDLYIACGRNALYARQGRASANIQARLANELFKKDQEYTDYYNNTLAGGKWVNMMNQTHIGYTSWQSPRQNTLPKLIELQIPDTSDFGISIDGSPDAWPGTASEPELPTFDSINNQQSHIEVFSKGSKPINVKVTSNVNWITIVMDKPLAGSDDHRYQVSINWNQAPAGESKGVITISDGKQTVDVKVIALQATEMQAKGAAGCFGGLSGPVAFLASDAVNQTAVGNLKWEKIPDYGRVESAMSIFPVTSDSIHPPNPSPTLEYPVYFARPGDYTISIITGPTLNLIPSRGLNLSVSIDDHPPQVKNVFSTESSKDEDFQGKNHHRNTAGNARTMQFTQSVTLPGKHSLRIHMIDPNLVLQKIIIHDQPLPPSYFGPPARGVNPLP